MRENSNFEFEREQYQLYEQKDVRKASTAGRELFFLRHL